MKKFLVLVFSGLFLMGCSSTGVGDTQDNRVASVTNVEVQSGGYYIHVDGDNNVLDCFAVDLNGSQCQTEKYFEGVYEPPISDI